jgi:hypothetical protein
MPQARSIWAMIRCGPGGETAAPAQMAPRSSCPVAAGSRPSASRFGCLRAWGSAWNFARREGGCDTCCTRVLYTNNKFVLVLHSAVLDSAVLQCTLLCSITVLKEPSLCAHCISSVYTGYPLCTLAVRLAGCSIYTVVWPVQLDFTVCGIQPIFEGHSACTHFTMPGPHTNICTTGPHINRRKSPKKSRRLRRRLR